MVNFGAFWRNKFKVTSLELQQIASKSNGTSGIFDHGKPEYVAKWLWQWSTTGNGNIDVLGANLAILVVDRCRNHLSNLLSSLSSRICRWNFDGICQSSRDVTISGFWSIPIFPYCRPLLHVLANTIFRLHIVLNLRFIGILTVPHIVSDVL